MAYEPSFERTDVIDALCMEIAEFVGMLSPQAPLSTSPTLRRELRIQTIYSSLVIEGNKLDEHAVSAIIDGKRVLGDRRDILEVENARAAYDRISELDPHSVEDLLRVHRVMMGGPRPRRWALSVGQCLRVQRGYPHSCWHSGGLRSGGYGRPLRVAACDANAPAARLVHFPLRVRVLPPLF